MKRLRLIVAAALAVIALAAIAAPAGAADTKGTLALVNGIPGKKVDICLNGQEIKSNLAYGGHVFRNATATGDKNLKFYRHDRRRCRGTRLGQTSFALDPAEDLTIVVTKKRPKIVTFDNAGLGEIPPSGTPEPQAPRANRNAADLVVEPRNRVWGTHSEQVFKPSDVFLKGQENVANGLAPELIVQSRAILGPGIVITAPLIQTVASHRYEWIVVGTTLENARIVFLDRLVSQPTP